LLPKRAIAEYDTIPNADPKTVIDVAPEVGPFV
jgi:hypothetical protein